jgi:copper chaperone NosL
MIMGVLLFPLWVGSRQMLIFTATAWPGIGGWLAMLAVGIGIACVVYEYRFRGRVSPAPGRRVAHPAAPVTACVLLCAAVAGATLLTSCAQKPASIAFGSDACEQCSMTIVDQRHGAVCVSDKGRSYKFDSVECMMEALAANGKYAGMKVRSFFVVDYAHPGRIVEASRATFLLSPNLPSSMGANVTCFAQEIDANHVRTEKGGDLMTWQSLKSRLVESAKS